MPVAFLFASRYTTSQHHTFGWPDADSRLPWMWLERAGHPSNASMNDKRRPFFITVWQNQGRWNADGEFGDMALPTEGHAWSRDNGTPGQAAKAVGEMMDL